MKYIVSVVEKVKAEQEGIAIDQILVQMDYLYEKEKKSMALFEKLLKKPNGISEVCSAIDSCASGVRVV
jgi:hypothetical protein